MTIDCKFSEHCGGGHTTAQHHVNVYERVIKEACGYEAFYAIAEAVNKAALADTEIASLREQLSETGWMLEGLRR